jgi:hypothetical protein
MTWSFLLSTKMRDPKESETPEHRKRRDGDLWVLETLPLGANRAGFVMSSGLIILYTTHSPASLSFAQATCCPISTLISMALTTALLETILG